MGKEVSFTSIHSLPPGTEDIPRDLGTAELNSSVDLQTELLRAGWAKTKELKRDPTDEDIKRQELEEDARKGGRGMWNPQGAKVELYLFMSTLSHVTKEVVDTRSTSKYACRFPGIFTRMERKVARW